MISLEDALSLTTLEDQMAFPIVNTTDFSEYYFNSTIDHFNTSIYNETQFSIQYWVNDKYFNSVNGSVFLYLCGEWNCEPFTDASYPLSVAAQLNSIIILLEHRYYGES